MKIKKIIAGLLVVSLVASVITITTRANQRDISTEPIATYTFEDSLQNVAGDASDKASAIVTGLSNYTGSIQYNADGHTGKAVKLGNYGLVLNKKNIGGEYSISMWVKPDGKFIDNQPVVFLGYHSPEKWLAIAGNGGGNQSVKLWNNDSNDGAYNWAVITSADISAGEWHNIVITQTGNNASFYLDGALISEGSAPAALTGNNQDIYLGVNNWDNEFAGLVDDVNIYNRILSADEIYSQYDTRTPADILKEEGFSVQSKLTMLKGETRKISAEMLDVIKNAEPKITYESNNTDIAAVDASGVVTGVAAGEAVVTTTVKIDDISVSENTTIVK